MTFAPHEFTRDSPDRLFVSVSAITPLSPASLSLFPTFQYLLVVLVVLPSSFQLAPSFADNLLGNGAVGRCYRSLDDDVTSNR